MPAPIIEFVDVSVNVGGAVADKFSFGTLMGVFAHTVNTDRQNGPFFSLTAANTAGFDAASEPAANAWITAAFAQDDGVDQVLIGLQAVGDAGDWTVTMDAIELAGSDTWYISNIESRADADIEDVSAWTEARQKIYVAQSDDITGTEALVMQAAGRNRSALAYHAMDAEYLDGGWSSSGGGMNLDVPGGVGIWAYRQLESIPFDPLTGAQALALFAANANVYGRSKGLNFTSKGTMASGRFMDVQTSVDWVKVRLEEAVLGAFVGANSIPYTNAGITQLVAVVSGVLTQGQAFGHFSIDVTPRIIAPDISQVSAADKQNRVLTLTVEVTLAGAIQQLILTVNVTL